MKTDPRSNYDAAFAHGLAFEPKTLSIEGVEHLVVPENSGVKSFENLMPAPQRIQARHEFHDIDSFSRYFLEFADEPTRIFVDEDSARFTAVFDCHQKDKPAWGEHRIDLSMAKSSEWSKFCRCNNSRMGQREFAEFIEDSVDYIVGPGEYTGAKMLEVAQNVAITIKGDFKCNDTMVSGLKVLSIQDESTASAQIGEKKISIPATLDLALRVFRGSASYKFSANLRHRASKDGIMFWYTIPDIERVHEDAFNHVVGQVEKACKRKVYKGVYSRK